MQNEFPIPTQAQWSNSAIPIHPTYPNSNPNPAAYPTAYPAESPMNQSQTSARVFFIGRQPECIAAHNLLSYNGEFNAAVREKCYQEFNPNSNSKFNPNLIKCIWQDQDAGVRVYSDCSPQDIEKTLFRQSGYAMPLEERIITKYRVVASFAHYIGDGSGNSYPESPQFTLMLTSCAPNLRGVSENPRDWAACMKQSQDGSWNLNQQGYYEQMYWVWYRFFSSANFEGQRLGQPIDVLTSFLGAGAYLEGLQPADKIQARKFIIQAMIEVANLKDDNGKSVFPYIGEINLCIPANKNGTQSEMSTLAYGIVFEYSNNPTYAKTIILSDTDMLALGRQLGCMGRVTAIINPGSDHVIGGGVYNDRGLPLQNGGHSYKPVEHGGADINQPGEFNPHPRAFEEQLGHYTNFVYVQNLGQNPRKDKVEFRNFKNQWIPYAIQLEQAQPVPLPASFQSNVPQILPHSPSVFLQTSLGQSTLQEITHDPKFTNIAKAVRLKIGGNNIIQINTGNNPTGELVYIFSFINESEAQVFASNIRKGKAVQPGANNSYLVYLTTEQYHQLEHGFKSLVQSTTLRQNQPVSPANQVHPVVQPFSIQQNRPQGPSQAMPQMTDAQRDRIEQERNKIVQRSLQNPEKPVLPPRGNKSNPNQFFKPSTPDLQPVQFETLKFDKDPTSQQKIIIQGIKDSLKDLHNFSINEIKVDINPIRYQILFDKKVENTFSDIVFGYGIVSEDPRTLGAKKECHPCHGANQYNMIFSEEQFDRLSGALEDAKLFKDRVNKFVETYGKTDVEKKIDMEKFFHEAGVFLPSDNLSEYLHVISVLEKAYQQVKVTASRHKDENIRVLNSKLMETLNALLDKKPNGSVRFRLEKIINSSELAEANGRIFGFGDNAAKKRLKEYERKIPNDLRSSVIPK